MSIKNEKIENKINNNVNIKPGRKKKSSTGKSNNAEKSTIEQINEISIEWKEQRIKNINQLQKQISSINSHLQSIRYNNECKIDEYISLKNIKSNLEVELKNLQDDVEGKALESYKQREIERSNFCQLSAE